MTSLSTNSSYSGSGALPSPCSVLALALLLLLRTALDTVAVESAPSPHRAPRR